MKIIIANILISISLIIMVIYGTNKNNSFINISKIIKDHFKIFSGAKKHIIILYIMPIITSIGISLIYSFSNSMIEAIMVVISVIISALLAFQGGILNIRKNGNEREIEILNETNASINFTALINIILIFLMLVYIAMNNEMIKLIFTAIIVYILLITFLTILIIIKRVRVLLGYNKY